MPKLKNCGNCKHYVHGVDELCRRWPRELIVKREPLFPVFLRGYKETATWKFPKTSEFSCCGEHQRRKND